MRTVSPQRVLRKAQAISSAMATPTGNGALMRSAACTAGVSLRKPRSIAGICGACGCISGLPR